MIYPRCKPLRSRPASPTRSVPPSPSGPESSAPPRSPQRQQSPPALHSISRSNSPKRDDIFLKSRVDQSIHLMKIIYEKAGEPVRPSGHSQFDALGALKSEMAFKVLSKKSWADFFDDIKHSRAHEDKPPRESAPASRMGHEPSQFASISFVRTAEEIERDKADSEETFRLMKKRVQGLWKELKIPASDTDFYSYNLLRSCNGTMEQFSDLGRYIVVLNNYRGSTIAVLNEIRNREFAVVSLLDCLSQVKRRSGLDSRPDLINCFQAVQIATINVIHQIQNWRANFWRPLPFHFRGENYLLKMQTDLDALKTESLGLILRECKFHAVDLVCILFSMENLSLDDVPSECVGDEFIRLVGAVPLQALNDAALVVLEEAALQSDLKIERKRLLKDGVFIPMLRYEHSMASDSSHQVPTRISGGAIPAADPTVNAATLPTSSASFTNNSQITDSSSRVDV